jgi:Mrp family chromosome partitioning ATPase
VVINVSKPIWRCEICGETFGESRETAERCESAGKPFELPAGTLMLDYNARGGWKQTEGFLIRRLFAGGYRYGTLAATHHQRTGHTVKYVLDLNPPDFWDAARGYHRWPDGSQPSTVTSEVLWPNLAGRLQLRGETWLGHHATINDHADYGWVFDAVGLPHGTVDPGGELSQAYWTRPLTPEIKAVLDELHAYPDFIHRRSDIRKLTHPWIIKTRAASLALNTVGRVNGGPANTRRTLWYLRGADEDALCERLNEMWRTWRGGSGTLVNHEWDVCELGTQDVPAPKVRSTRDHLTASKINNKIKALVAATGIEWPVRTNATAYCNLLLDKLLEYRVETDNSLFPGRRVIAVRGRKGGVGKSTVAAALAQRLAYAGRRVALVDFDLAGPSQHILHNLPAGVEIDTERVMILPAQTAVDGLVVFSPGQVFPPAANNQWSQTSIGQWVDFVGSSLDLGDTEIVVLDMPPGENAVHANLSHAIDVEVHVTTGHPLSLADTERDLVADRRRPLSRYLIENLSRVRGVTGAGDQVEVRLHGLTEDAPALAERTKTTWAGSLPWATGGVIELAGCDEIAQLAAVVADAPVVNR